MMKDHKMTFEEINRMSAQEIRELINNDFALFKAYWDARAPQDDDLHFYKTADGYDVIVSGGIEDLEDNSYALNDRQDEVRK